MTMTVLLLALFAQQEQQQQWEIRGTVRTDKGPIKNLFVTVSGPENIRPARTDSEGRFAFAGREPGAYVVAVAKNEDVAEARSRNIRVSIGQKIEGVDFLLARGATVSGRVIDAEKRPVVGMAVSAYLKSMINGKLRLEMKGGTRTESDGTYRIRNLPAGTFVVAAVPGLTKPLQATIFANVPEKLPAAYPAMTFAPGTRDPGAALTLQLAPGDTREAFDIVAEKRPAFCVSFAANALFPQQARQPELRVTVKEWIGIDGATIAEGPLKPGGQHQVCGLAEGDYRLHFVAFQKNPIEGLGYARQSALLSREHLRLPAVAVPGTGEIAGRVFIRDAPRDQPLPSGIELRLIRGERPLLPQDGWSVRPSSGDGTFRMSGVYVDRYGVEVRNLPKGHYVRSTTQAGQSDVAPGGGEVSIELGADGAALSGRVVTKDGKPVSDATVILGKRGGGEVSWIAVCDQNGTFEFASGIVEGSYKIAAMDLPFDSQRRDPQVLARFLERGTDIQLSPKESRLVDVLLLPPSE
jgi:hypothetical protein